MKKAKLDILEQLPEIDIERPAAKSITDAEVVMHIPDTTGAKTWAFNKILLIGAPAALIVLMICGALVYFLFFGKAPDHPKATSVATQQTDTAKAGTVQGSLDGDRPVSGPDERVSVVRDNLLKTAYVRNFMIDLRDSSGNHRVLLCDIAFDLGPDQTQESFENNVAVRNIIYNAARSRSAVALKSVEERKKFKQDLASELDLLLGKGSVKNVFFINYFIM